MKTPLTNSAAKTSADTKQRWTQIENWVSADVEQRLRNKVRHILLGCSHCKPAEIAYVLVSGFKMLHSEAALVMELLTEEYRMSDTGKKELKELKDDKLPPLLHAKDGEPQALQEISSGVYCAPGVFVGTIKVVGGPDATQPHRTGDGFQCADVAGSGKAEPAIVIHSANLPTDTFIGNPRWLQLSPPTKPFTDLADAMKAFHGTDIDWYEQFLPGMPRAVMRCAGTRLRLEGIPAMRSAQTPAQQQRVEQVLLEEYENNPPSQVDQDVASILVEHCCGVGINEQIEVRCLAPAQYTVTLPYKKPAIPLPVPLRREIMHLRFQKGSPSDANGVNGLTLEAVLAVVLHRIVALNQVQFCEENVAASEYISFALNALKNRTQRLSKTQKPVSESSF